MTNDGAADPGESQKRIILDGVIYKPVSSVVASRAQRSQVSVYNNSEFRRMKPYRYNDLVSMHRQLRLLCLHGGGLFNPEITCELIEVEFDKFDQNAVRRALSRDERIRRERRHARRMARDQSSDVQASKLDHDVVEYEALSWCWGQGPKDHAIKIQEGGSHYRLDVTKELILALKYLRYPNEKRILWIDAICINQVNHEERNHQVQMMSRIYSGAKQVCVWLGEDTDDSTTAISFIREIMELDNFDAASASKEAVSKWHSLLILMQRPWFSRRWVVQEIALARSATIYCGIDNISWTSFAVAVELFVEIETATHRLSEVMRKDMPVPQWFEHISELGASVLVQATGKVFRRDGDKAMDPEEDFNDHYRHRAPRNIRKSIKGTRENYEWVKPSQPLAFVSQRRLLSLEYLVSSLSVFQASQPRDAVYSLLAIARDTVPFAGLQNKPQSGFEEAIIMPTVSRCLGQTPFKIDYSRSYSDVCKDFVSFCLHISQKSDPTRALDILCRPWAPEPELTAGAVVHGKPTLYKFLPSHERESLWPLGRGRRTFFRVSAEYHSSDIICQIQAKEQRIGAPKLRKPDPRSKGEYWRDCEEDWKSNFQERVRTFERDVKPFLPKKREPQVEGRGKSSLDNEESGSEAGDPGSDDEEQDQHEKDIPLPSWVSRISDAPFALYRHPGMHKLGRIGRVQADPLVGLPQDGRKNYDAAQNTKVSFDSSHHVRFRKRPKSGHYSLFTDGFILAEVEAVAEPARLGAIPETWPSFAGWPSAVNGETDPPVEFWRTLVADRGKDGRNAPYYYATACRESVKKGGLRGGSVDTGALINSERNSIIAEFCRRVQAVIWNRCLIKTNEPVNALGLASQHVRKGDLICVIFGCTVPVILRKFKKEPGDLEMERMQDKIEAMKVAMATCEEARFRKLHYQKRLQKEREKGRRLGNLWEEEVLAEWKDINIQMKRWKEREDEEKKREEAQHKEQQARMKIRKKNAENRRAIAMGTTPAMLTSLGEQIRVHASTPNLRSMDTYTNHVMVNGVEKEGPRWVGSTHTILPHGHGQDREDEAGETKSPPEKVCSERRRRERLAKDEDPLVYYQLIGEAYIHGMMDGEAVRLHINEGIPRRTFEIR